VGLVIFSGEGQRAPLRFHNAICDCRLYARPAVLQTLASGPSTRLTTQSE
jgi:hypothetical protein